MLRPLRREHRPQDANVDRLAASPDLEAATLEMRGLAKIDAALGVYQCVAEREAREEVKSDGDGLAAGA